MNNLSKFADLALPELGVKVHPNSRDLVRAYTKAFGTPTHISGATHSGLTDDTAIYGGIQTGHDYKVISFKNGRKLVIWRPMVKSSDGRIAIYRNYALRSDPLATYQIPAWTENEVTSVYTDLDLFINGTKTAPAAQPFTARKETLEARIAADQATLRRIDALASEEARIEAEKKAADDAQAEVDRQEAALQELILEQKAKRDKATAKQKKVQVYMEQLRIQKRDLGLL